MDLQTAILSALASVTSALCYLFGLLWKRSQQCEKWRAEKEPLIEAMAQNLGIHTGISRIVNTCNTKDCPYAGKLIPETLSIHKSN